jgi:hypothetical protein
MYRILLRGEAARRGAPLTREGPPSVDLEVLGLFPVNRLIPDDTLFVREAADAAHPTAQPIAQTERQRVWM